MNTINTRKLTSIRLNSNLYEHLNKLAKKDNRSFNNYIETLLSYASDFSEPNEETKMAIEESRKERKSAARFTDIDSLIASLEE
ncbi:toxin-antitoxin system protein [Petrimonas sp.]|uniref:toxin-antitoxin system protein n=1 Tax=Petrimonas sp. TaxID=2023866 RepID=UPI003F5110D8